jgi:hypothetical protein
MCVRWRGVFAAAWCVGMAAGRDLTNALVQEVSVEGGHWLSRHVMVSREMSVMTMSPQQTAA